MIYDMITFYPEMGYFMVLQMKGCFLRSRQFVVSKLVVGDTNVGGLVGFLGTPKTLI